MKYSENKGIIYQAFLVLILIFYTEASILSAEVFQNPFPVPMENKPGVLSTWLPNLLNTAIFLALAVSSGGGFGVTCHVKNIHCVDAGFPTLSFLRGNVSSPFC